MKAPKFSAYLRLSEMATRARQVAEARAARTAETACLAGLTVLLLLAACSPPPPPPGASPPPMEYRHPGTWYMADTAD